MKIIVAVDGSILSKKALEFAITLAKAFGDELRLINIQANHVVLGEAVIKEATALVEKELTSFSTAIRIGTPAIEILSEAKDANVRCVVMGTKGSNNSKSRIGSVSQAIIDLGLCPVMLIPN